MVSLAGWLWRDFWDSCGSRFVWGERRKPAGWGDLAVCRDGGGLLAWSQGPWWLPWGRTPVVALLGGAHWLSLEDLVP